MKKGRHSILTKIGRLFQKINPICFRWIEFIYKKKVIKQYPMIVIIAPPRSGSTLTYQILTNGSRSLYLTNLWNLLYALPLIGGLLSKDKKSCSNFISNKGWVDGLYGQSEGMRFWEYWIGQSLEQPIKKVPISRIKYLQKVFGRLIIKNNPMITAYLGHAFSMSNLRTIFPGITFIYVKRDKLSNVYSLFNIVKAKKWFSLKPMSWKDKIHLNIYERVVWQYNCVISSIEKDILKEDTLVVNYEDICNDSHQFLKDVKYFVDKRGIDLQLEFDLIPGSFKVRNIDEGFNEDTKILYKLIKDE